MTSPGLPEVGPGPAASVLRTGRAHPLSENLALASGRRLSFVSNFNIRAGTSFLCNREKEDFLPRPPSSPRQEYRCSPGAERVRRNHLLAPVRLVASCIR